MSFKHLSFVDLFNKEEFFIEIPMLQRDYAYGRNSEKEKRTEFLKSLKTYLCSETVDHELDFIYGSVNRPQGHNVLTLLDGQQRITTIFLMHWYFALAAGRNAYDSFRKMLWDDEKKTSRFTYKTRYSSSEFCDSLVYLHAKFSENEEDLVEEFIERVKQNKLSSASIKNEKWYFLHWNNDPTIMNMCSMLDAIISYFPYDCAKDLYAKLNKSGSESSITFNFLNLEDYGLTDELYIKMNSRGKPLTRYENLKSKILESIDGLKTLQSCKDLLSKINEENSSNYESLRDYVSLMLDTKWTDVFWNAWLEKNPQNVDNPPIDDMLLRFICNFCICSSVLQQMSNNLSIARQDPIKKNIEDLLKKRMLIPYESLLDMLLQNDASTLFDLLRVFDLLSEKDDKGKWVLKRYLNDDFWCYSEKLYFESVVDGSLGDAGYETRVMYFAYLQYLLKYRPLKDDDLLKKWMRFVYAVAKNSINLNNGAETFCNSVAGFNFLIGKDIAVSLQQKDLGQVITLDPYQLKEEKLKSHLSQNVLWKDAFEESFNKHSYFEGHSYYEMFDYCELTEDDVNDTAKITAFKDVVEKVHSIFPDSKGCSFEKELIRAMLSKGDYSLAKGINKSLLQNNDRDVSWRKFLKKDDLDKHKTIFRSVIDDSLFDETKPESSLKNIADQRSSTIDKWRLAIVDNPSILDKLGSNRFIRWNDKSGRSHAMDKRDNFEIDLISKTMITSDHYELFSYVLFENLNSKFKLEYAHTNLENLQPYFVCKDSSEKKSICSVFYADNDQFKIEIDESIDCSDQGNLNFFSQSAYSIENGKYCKLVQTSNVEQELNALVSNIT